MSEFQRIECMRRAHYEASEPVAVETDNERAVRQHMSNIDSRDMRDQNCGGGRRVIRKRLVGGD